MRYFADTSFWLALLSRRDEYHQAAVKWRKQIGAVELVTTDLVLWELLNGCAASAMRLSAATVFDRCMSDPQVQVVWADPVLAQHGVHLYKSRPDKTWSLTDCVSFVVMQEQHMQDALTSDHHFEQAGFNALLRQK